MDYFIECAEHLSKIPKVVITTELAEKVITTAMQPKFTLTPLPHDRKIVAQLEFSIEPLFNNARYHYTERADRVGQFISVILEAMVKDCEKQIQTHRNRDAVAWLYNL